MFEKFAAALKELNIYASLSYNRWSNTYEFAFMRDAFGGKHHWMTRAKPEDLDRYGYFDDLIEQVKSHLSDESIFESIKRAIT